MAKKSEIPKEDCEKAGSDARRESAVEAQATGGAKTSKRRRRRCVGRGDDRIEWKSPLAGWPTLLGICSTCDEYGYSFPHEEMTGFLQAHGVDVELGPPKDDEDLLCAILEPYLDISRKHWDGGAPGCSGVWKEAYLTLGSIREVKRRLRWAGSFLLKWMVSSGLDAEIDANWVKQDRGRRERALESERKAQQFAEEKARAVAEWEATLEREVKEAVWRADDVPYCRLNFLVHRGVAFSLNRGWWHKLPGSVAKVVAQLEESGVRLIRCPVDFTRYGWIPYFARCNPEETVVGWNEEGLRVSVRSAAAAKRLQEAREAWACRRASEV